MGFDCTILDVLDGPPLVLGLACKNNNVQNIPVTLRTLERTTEVERNPKVSQFVSGSMSYRIMRRYGSQTVRGQKCREASFLKTAVDTNRKAELEASIEELREQLEAIQKRTAEKSAEEQKVRKQDNKIRQEKETLTRRRKEMEEELKSFHRILTQIDIKQNQFEKTKQEDSSTDEKEAEVMRGLKACHVKKAKLALDFHKVQGDLMDVAQQWVVAELRSVKLQAEHLASVNKMRDLQEDKETAQHEFDRAKQEFDRTKTLAREAKDEYVNLAHKDGLTEDECAQIVEELHPGVSADELEDLVEEKRTRVGLIMAVDPAALERFEKDKKSIAKKESERDAKTVRAEELAGRIRRVRGKWEPQLQQLVVRISESFSQAFDSIGCSGEVKLNPDESDYAKWGIDILVKFRDNEKLNALDGHRQSGGERAVSTILYLMSLQSLSSTPFRVVDEINQGMDPRNERMVHGEMVRAACTAGTSQYFLITPKLLPDLQYHERMRVLCVYNGPWSLEKIDLRAWLRKKVGRGG
ncbi:Structural maintenance of chromosomes protein 5 [Rhizophlyctis rosea]|nr:Structural maintenance of chromosomes protein 5 [Rhizophlyctis rosea]